MNTTLARKKLNLNEYLQSYGVRNKSVEIIDGNNAVVEKEIIDSYKNIERPLELVDLVTVIKANTPSGAIRATDFVEDYLEQISKDQTELIESPTIPKNVPYSIKTFGGYIYISQEQMDDGEINIIDYIGKKIECLERQTKNKEIGKILATAPSKTVSDIDGIKDIISTLKPERINSIVLTSSLFNTLNKLKDSTGQDILSVNKTNYSSSTFFVNYFLVVSDTILGNAGDKKAFIGDIENFATLFDYEKSSISWNTQYLIYGSSLRFTSRFDVEKVNSDCGYLVEWS